MSIKATRPLQIGITLRTALLSWLVTIATLAIFVLVIIPQQKRTFLENLDSKAHGIAVSLRDVAAGAAVNEDFSSVVDHCKEMLKGDEALIYLVITKNDGFSLINERNGWRSEVKSDSFWRPATRKSHRGIGSVPLMSTPVYFYSQPFDYSGIEWGWIHVGLSLDSYNRSVQMVYTRTIFLAIFCIILSLGASGLYARQLVMPILKLREVVKKVADGDLDVRAPVWRNDELGGLASSVNSMTEALSQRDRILQSVRFTAEQFLSINKWDLVIQEVLKRIGEAAGAQRVYVFSTEVQADRSWLSSLKFEWIRSGMTPQLANPDYQNFDWAAAGLSDWAERLNRFEPVSTTSNHWKLACCPSNSSHQECAVMLIPINVENAWWGILGLDAPKFNQGWTQAEKDSFRAVAEMLGAAISRQKTQDALLKAKEAAEAASMAKSQFLANMSHEIRTPINGVIGMLRLLQRTSLADNQHRYVSNTMASADALLTVIGDILDFSKIEAGRMELETCAFPVGETMETAVRLLVDKAEAKGIEVCSSVHAEVPDFVVGDPDRLRQILLNLLSNAVKFTDSGSIIVSCRVEKMSDENVSLRFKVKDTGRGIPPEQQSVIFDPFRQVDNSMSRSHGGTGLGLTISQQLVRLMGGRIGVESTPGEGSTFWFTAQFKSASADGETRHKTETPDLRGLRVLIVDDCEAVRELVCNYLKAWKGFPECASDATEALATLRKAAGDGHPFSVVILDWKMPGLDGIALARELRKENANSQPGLVLLTGFAMEDRLDECKTAGFSSVISKPVRKSELHEAILIAANGVAAGEMSNVLLNSRKRQAAPRKCTRECTVLLAEDNEINQEVASEMLQELGYRFVRVRNGREALESVKNGVGELVLMDCQMPEMDGYEATRAIRGWEEQAQREGRNCKHTPIVALTAHAMKGDRARCLAAGMDDYLTKPLELETLAATLAKHVTASAKSRESKSNGNSPTQTESAGPQPSGVDIQGLLRRCMGRKDLAERLFAKFLTQSAGDIHELQAALKARDVRRMSTLAHRLKGAAANVSATALQEMASRLETLAREGDFLSADEWLTRLREKMELLRGMNLENPAEQTQETVIALNHHSFRPSTRPDSFR